MNFSRSAAGGRAKAASCTARTSVRATLTCGGAVTRLTARMPALAIVTPVVRRGRTNGRMAKRPAECPDPTYMCALPIVLPSTVSWRNDGHRISVFSLREGIVRRGRRDECSSTLLLSPLISARYCIVAPGVSAFYGPEVGAKRTGRSFPVAGFLPQTVLTSGRIDVSGVCHVDPIDVAGEAERCFVVVVLRHW